VFNGGYLAARMAKRLIEVCDKTGIVARQGAPTMFTVRLSEDLEAQLSKAAKELGVSKSGFARDAIAHRIHKWEDDLLVQAQPDDTQLPVQ
jgi:predicted HicB family RNase H-like nuclease